MLDIKGKVFEKLKEGKNDEHVTDLSEWHPHRACYCKRQLLVRKCGFTELPIQALSAMKGGSLIHEWMEFVGEEDKFEAEKDLEGEFHGVKFKGRADLIGPEAVYDFKTTGNIKYTDGAKEKHERQLEIYLRLAGREKGAIAYIDRRYPHNIKQYKVEKSDERFRSIVENVKEVKKVIEGWKGADIILQDDIPFEKCGCYFCNNEDLANCTLNIKEVNHEED